MVRGFYCRAGECQVLGLAVPLNVAYFYPQPSKRIASSPGRIGNKQRSLLHTFGYLKLKLDSNLSILVMNEQTATLKNDQGKCEFWKKIKNCL